MLSGLWARAKSVVDLLEGKCRAHNRCRISVDGCLFVAKYNLARLHSIVSLLVVVAFFVDIGISVDSYSVECQTFSEQNLFPVLSDMTI